MIRGKKQMAWMIANEENLEHLEHYGIPGMEWGVRRFLDETGHLTAAGRARYNTKSEKYTQSGGLKKRKAYIEQLQTTAKALRDKKASKNERKKVAEELKAVRKEYREDSKAERANWTAAQKQQREELREERENLKEVNRYSQFNKKMARSVENINKFTELMGRYGGRSEEQIKARKASLEAKAQKHKDEAENVRNMDVRDVKNNVARFQAAMKNFKKRR